MFDLFGGPTHNTKDADDSLKQPGPIAWAFNSAFNVVKYPFEKFGEGLTAAADHGWKFMVAGAAGGGIKALADGKSGTDVIPMMLGGSIIAGIGGGVAVGAGTTVLSVGQDLFGLLPGVGNEPSEPLSPPQTPQLAQSQQNAKG